VGLTALVQGAVYLTAFDSSTLGAKMTGLIAIASGVALLLGLFTPFAGALIGLGSACLALSWLPVPAPRLLDSWLATVFVVVMAAVIVFLGPGAFSLDAHLFGRREIVIPPARPSSKS
jgi:uncharacterized membrane protein YphA (DoxX/SURF4 family)